MRSLNFLFEDEDQDQNNSQGLRRTKDIILFAKDTPTEQVEKALLDLSNYGQYIPYQQKVNPSIKTKTANILGPSGSPQIKYTLSSQMVEFATKLQNMLMHADNSHVIRWDEDGLNVVILTTLRYDIIPCVYRPTCF